MSDKSLRISLIVIHYGDLELLSNLLYSLESSYDSALINEIVIVNNGLTLSEKDKEKLQLYHKIFLKIVDNSNGTYAAGVNCGAAKAKGNILIFANNDVEWLPGTSIRSLIECFKDNKVGIAGPQLIYPDGRWQRSFGLFPSIRQAFISLMMLDSLYNSVNAWAFKKGYSIKKPREVEYIDGAFMAVRRSCFEQLKGFDESYLFYGEDADFCWRAHKKGWKVVFCPSSKIIHIRGASSMKIDIENYAIKLFQAQFKFVKQYYGSDQAGWYNKLLAIILYERIVIYNLMWKMTHLSTWKDRALFAQIRYKVYIKRKENLQ